MLLQAKRNLHRPPMALKLASDDSQRKRAYIHGRFSTIRAISGENSGPRLVLYGENRYFLCARSTKKAIATDCTARGFLHHDGDTWSVFCFPIPNIVGPTAVTALAKPKVKHIRYVFCNSYALPKNSFHRPEILLGIKRAPAHLSFRSQRCVTCNALYSG